MGCSGSKDARVTDPGEDLVAPSGENKAIHEYAPASAGHAVAHALHFHELSRRLLCVCVQATQKRTAPPEHGVCLWLLKPKR